MAAQSPAAPRIPINYSTRVDEVGSRVRTINTVRVVLVVIIAIIMLIPVGWMTLTAFKSRPDAVAAPPKLFFTPTLEGFVSLLTDRRQLTAEQLEEAQKRTDLSWMDQIALSRGQLITGPSNYPRRLLNSLIVAGVSTVFSVGLGLLSAYSFSRFSIPGAGDLLFFILSTRMLPPVVVTIPLFLMYRALGIYDTHFGLILLYSVFNLSFSVWLLKGFIDEIPREYEEAAMVDGYTRLQAFRKIVLPQSVTGIAATTVFCLIFAWNEYAFAALLTSGTAQTAPPFIPTIIGEGGLDWPAVGAGTTIFLVPILIFTVLLRKHLLRGITFGAVRK